MHTLTFQNYGRSYKGFTKTIKKCNTQNFQLKQSHAIAEYFENCISLLGDQDRQNDTEKHS